MKKTEKTKLRAASFGDFIKMQKAEAEGAAIYARLAAVASDSGNSNVLKKLSGEETRHYNLLKKYTGEEVRPGTFAVFKAVFFARVFGLTFALKLMERGESKASVNYETYSRTFPDIAAIANDEKGHEKRLLGMLHEEVLNYMGSVVLGLNDALVELTGALVGFTFALSSSRLIGMIGLITGVSAALSMAASEYLSTKAEKNGNSALKASIYTGIAYIVTVAILVAPYLFLGNGYLSLAIMFASALVIIALFNYYYSVVKDESFRSRFAEMAVLSGVVSLVSFGIGVAVRRFTGLEI